MSLFEKHCQKCVLQAVNVVYLVALIVALLILVIKIQDEHFSWLLFFFFMLEKIVITPNLEVRHIYIIRLQLVFNCTPFVNLMALPN